jgi:hypothetical protein
MKHAEMTDDPYVRDMLYASPSVREQSASVVQIDSSKSLVLVAIMAAFSGIALTLAVWSARESHETATELRLVQYYLMDPHSRTPDELAAWAKFNAERESAIKE